MKALIASCFAGLFFSSTAGAMVPEPGTFIASYCGEESTFGGSATFISAICVGRVAQINSQNGDDRAAQFRMLDGTNVAFLVKSSTNPLVDSVSDDSNIIYRLESLDGREHAILRAVVAPDKSVKSMSGEYHGAEFIVPQTKQMMTILHD